MELMDFLLIGGLGALSVLAALYLQARAFVQITKDNLAFLEKNMMVGGTPIDLARTQQLHQIEVSRAELERIKELRAQRFSSLSD